MEIIRTQKNFSRMEVKQTPNISPDPFELSALSWSRLGICHTDCTTCKISMINIILLDRKLISFLQIFCKGLANSKSGLSTLKSHLVLAQSLLTITCSHFMLRSSLFNEKR
jgi:hypothetical protein